MTTINLRQLPEEEGEKSVFSKYGGFIFSIGIVALVAIFVIAINIWNAGLSAKSRNTEEAVKLENAQLSEKACGRADYGFADQNKIYRGKLRSATVHDKRFGSRGVNHGRRSDGE